MRAAFALFLGACHAHTAATFPGPLRPMLEAHAGSWDDTTYAGGLLDDLGDDTRPSRSTTTARAPSTTSASVTAPRSVRPGDAALNARICDAATRIVDRGLPRGARDDCSGFVLAALDIAGVSASGGTRDIWARAEAMGVTHKHAPSPGELVFFDNSYDRDGDGRRDDVLTHIGIVVEVAKDGTITIAHRASSAGLSFLHMNLNHPHERTSPAGDPWNDILRSGDPPGLASDLWRGFATVRPDDIVAWSDL